MTTSTMWVLIVLWFPAGSQSGKALLSHEFIGQEACERARTEVLRQERPGSDNTTLLRAVCVPKK